MLNGRTTRPQSLLAKGGKSALETEFSAYNKKWPIRCWSSKKYQGLCLKEARIPPIAGWAFYCPLLLLLALPRV